MDKHFIIKIFCLITVIILVSFYSGCMSFDLQNNSGCIYGDCENGFGIRRFERSKYIYTGEWKNGKMSGKGTLNSITYSAKSHGFWDQGKFIEGEISAKEGNYKVKFVNDEIIGEYTSNVSDVKYKGKFAYYRASFYGTYDNPFLLGPSNGQISWKNGDIYKGKLGYIKDYYSVFPSGHGLYITSDGKSYEGNFKIQREDKSWQGIIENNSSLTKFELKMIKDPVINYSIVIK